MTRHLIRIAGDDEGQTSVEYALVLLFVVIVLVLALATGIGGVLGGLAGKIITSIS